MKNTVLDVECQFLLLTAGQGDISALSTIPKISKELDIPICRCDNQFVDTSCLQKIETELRPFLGELARQRLLIVGRYREEQVTTCSLHGLYLGYEVLLLKDCTYSKKSGSHKNV